MGEGLGFRAVLLGLGVRVQGSSSGFGVCGSSSVWRLAFKVLLQGCC